MMNKSMMVCFVAFSVGAVAQTITGTGATFTPTASTTSTRILEYTGLGSGSYNNIVQNNDAGLIYDINGAFSTGAFVIAPHANATSGLRFDSSGNITSFSNMFMLGNVGIGTASPSPNAKLEVNGNAQIDGTVIATGFSGPFTGTLTQGGGYAYLGVYNTYPSSQIYPSYGSLGTAFAWNFSGGNAEEDIWNTTNPSSYPDTGFRFLQQTGASSYRDLIFIRQDGDVGIGTTSPGAALEVNGNIKMTYSPTNPSSLTFSDGSVQATAYTGVICGGDYAESVDVAGDRKNYEPGDVLVIGAESGSDVVKSASPYSTLVLGVYSTKPGVVGRRQNTDAKAGTTEVPMAMVGIVPTKVSAENGPIRRGDLLVTSSTVGYAMRGIDRSKMLGAVIGKALGTLDAGTGVIEVAITLQ
jgi:hypothetical protein